jgi:hypothetical protein
VRPACRRCPGRRREPLSLTPVRDESDQTAACARADAPAVDQSFPVCEAGTSVRRNQARQTVFRRARHTCVPSVCHFCVSDTSLTAVRLRGLAHGPGIAARGTSASPLVRQPPAQAAGRGCDAKQSVNAIRSLPRPGSIRREATCERARRSKASEPTEGNRRFPSAVNARLMVQIVCCDHSFAGEDVLSADRGTD